MAENNAISWGQTVRLLISRRWWWVTLVVLGGCALLVRLGIWQLDRLAWRRGLNAEITAFRDALLVAAPFGLLLLAVAGWLIARAAPRCDQRRDGSNRLSRPSQHAA